MKRYRLNLKVNRVIKAISSLKDEDQRILCYRYFDELNYSEIARRLGRSHKTIVNRINKINRK